MIGRAEEAAELEAVIAAAAAGRSGALILIGDLGFGKTTLMRHARARARASGARVLEVGGVQGESRLAFAGLADLLAPLLGSVGELPAAQAQALSGALALGPPSPGDRFSAYVATLRLLSVAAEDGPLVCLVDDAHWLDDESLEAVLFAARRLVAEGVAILIAGRDGISSRLDESTVPRRRLRGLTAEETAELVATRGGTRPEAGVAAVLCDGSGGNPLALVEMAATLTDAQLCGRDPLPDPLPVGPHLAAALLRPLEALPDETRRALGVVSCDDGGSTLVARALEIAGLAMTDLEPAERAGAVLVGPLRVVFSHPLLRSAVYGATAAPDRRAAHRAYAAAAEQAGDAAALDRRAWHLALAATGPDETVAAQLQEAAGRAGGRTAYAAAAEALETAARLSPESADRGRRLLMAGQSAVAAGDLGRAARVFEECAELAADPAQVIEAQVGRGFVEMLGASVTRATDMLAAAAARMEASSPTVAATLYTQAVVPCFMSTDLVRARTLTRRAATLAEAPPAPLAAQLEAAAAITATYSGSPRTLAAEAVEELSRQAASGDPIGYIWSLGHLQTLMIRERYADAIAGLDVVIGGGRERGTASSLPWPLAARAEVRRRTGRLTEALADASEALDLAEQTGQTGLVGYSHAVLALVHALLGRDGECRRHAEAARTIGEGAEAHSLRMFAEDALGLLALSVGEPAEAAGHFLTVSREETRIPEEHPLIDMFRCELAEVLVRLDDPRAAAAAATLEAQAVRSDATWGRAVVARCRGLAAGDDAFERHFADALDLHDRTDTPHERARTLLALGQRRRRARRVRDAREPLGEALTAFETVGAVHWAELARRELRAAGARARRPQPAVTGNLTPQELQVALTVSQGATNRETATALLISPKTVEYHLARVYAKLGVRSRAELAARMARETSDLLPDGSHD